MAAIRKSRGEARARMLREINGVPDGYLTTGGAAAYLGMTQSAVWLAYQKGQLDGERFGKLACFTQAALDAYAARRRYRRGRRKQHEQDGMPSCDKQASAPIPPSLTEQVCAALAGVMRAQRTADDGQQPRLCVLPRSDGSAGVYYRHPACLAYAAFVQIAGTHLAACQAVLAQAGFAVELCAPTAEGAPCWLWVRAR